MSKTEMVFGGLTESEKELLEEFRYELAADRRYNPTVAETPAEGIVRLSNAIGRIADAYEEKDGDLMEMHDEAVVLMVLAFRFALESWEDDGEEGE